ncbi:MAG: MFS transporter, partial [Burkholderiales bacterium]|nr:MFS transporter [Burkholderiales bacterium]
DIACDGLYLISLSSQEQAQYAGWLGAFFNGAKLFATGGMLWLAGYLEKQIGVKPAWSAIFAILGGLMFLLALYHSRALPDTRVAQNEASANVVAEKIPVVDVLVTFFQKPGIWFAIAFIVLFRLGEGQINAVGQLFLKDPRAVGGLGLDTKQIAEVYGIVGTVAFVGGSVLGGYFASWLGLKRAMFFLILAMNLPNAVFYFLAQSQTDNFQLIMLGLGIESFGYGFGFVGLVLFMMQVVSVGKYQTAHYALSTGIMQLGLLLPRAISGKVQLALGYQHFFLWVLLSAVPVLLLSFFLPGQKPAEKEETELVTNGAGA